MINWYRSKCILRIARFVSQNSVNPSGFSFSVVNMAIICDLRPVKTALGTLSLLSSIDKITSQGSFGSIIFENNAS